MRNETTPGRGYPLPVLDNKLNVDCEKLRQAIFAIDDDYVKLVEAWNAFHDLADVYLKRIDDRQGEFDETMARSLEAFFQQRNAFIEALGAENAALLAGMRQDVDDQIFRVTGLIPRYDDLVGEAFDAESTLPGRNECPLEYIHGLGLYRYDAANASPPDGELVVMGEGGLGRWVLALPSIDYVFAVLKKARVDLELLNKYRIDGVRHRKITGEATLTFTSLPAASTVTQTVTVEGAGVGDPVSVIPPPTLAGGLVFAGYVSAENTVAIRVSNITAAAITPAEASWTVIVVKEGSK